MLLVEDNPGDVFLIREALEQSGLHVRMHVADDGQQAMDFLRRPDMAGLDAVILDLNLPIKSGREVLAEMTADPALRRIPVAILTSSTAEEDAALQQHKEKCLFFTKTPDLTELVHIVTEIHAFVAPAAKER